MSLLVSYGAYMLLGVQSNQLKPEHEIDVCLYTKAQRNTTYGNFLKSAMSKRSASPPTGALVKRARATQPPANQIAMSWARDERGKCLIPRGHRTRNLHAP